MTRERCKELLPFMQAWAEGKEIQIRLLPSEGGPDLWETIGDGCSGPWLWLDGREYRIKPREWWIVINPISQTVFQNEAEASLYASRWPAAKAIRLIEAML